MLHIGFACVSASVQGTGHGSAERGQQNEYINNLEGTMINIQGRLFQICIFLCGTICCFLR